ncbi:HAD family hydrolase [Halobacillus fulvus]|nr:HAD family hydrolase [Halobacillus fulvus]
MIKAIIFDLDGTLLDRDTSVKVFVSRQYDRLNQRLQHIPKEKYIERFIQLDDHGYVWKDRVYRQLIHEFTIDRLTADELLHDYLIHFKDSCVPFPGLIEVLEELKRRHFQIGMITNGKGQFQLDNIKALGIDSYIEAILISDWEGIKKPDPLIFKRATKRLKVSPEECVFIGDHPEKDVEAAKKSGMRSVWKRNSHWDGVDADAVIFDLGELPDIIQSLHFT